METEVKNDVAVATPPAKPKKTTKPKKLKSLIQYAVRGVSSGKTVWWCCNPSGGAGVNDGWAAKDDHAFITPQLDLAKKVATQHQKDPGIKSVKIIKITMERTVTTEIIKV